MREGIKSGKGRRGNKRTRSTQVKEDKGKEEREINQTASITPGDSFKKVDGE